MELDGDGALSQGSDPDARITEHSAAAVEHVFYPLCKRLKQSSVETQELGLHPDDSEIWFNSTFKFFSLTFFDIYSRIKALIRNPLPVSPTHS